MGELVAAAAREDGMGVLVQRLFDARDDGLPYLTHRQESVGRGELRERVAKQAAVFAGYDIGPGSTVGLRTPPSFTQVEVLLALWRLGAQVMLFDFRLKPAEVDALCATCRPQFMVRAGSNVRAAFGFRPEYEVATECRRAGQPAAGPHRLVQFSSGSTGRPKVIGRTAASIAAEIESFGAVPGMPGEGDRLLLLSSTAHSFGLLGGLLHSLAAGVSVVFAPRVSARDILRTSVEHRITHLFGVPMHFELLAAALDPPALPELRTAVSGGELMPPEVAARFAERFGTTVGEAYGTTETGIVAIDVAARSGPRSGGPRRECWSGNTRANWTSRSTGLRISSTPAAPSTRTAGSTPATGPRWTPTERSPWAAAPTPSSSSAASRSTSPRSSTCSARTRPSNRRSWSTRT